MPLPDAGHRVAMNRHDASDSSIDGYERDDVVKALRVNDPIGDTVLSNHPPQSAGEIEAAWA